MSLIEDTPEITYRLRTLQRTVRDFYSQYLLSASARQELIKRAHTLNFYDPGDTVEVLKEELELALALDDLLRGLMAIKLLDRLIHGLDDSSIIDKAHWLEPGDLEFLNLLPGGTKPEDDDGPTPQQCVRDFYLLYLLGETGTSIIVDAAQARGHKDPETTVERLKEDIVIALALDELSLAVPALSLLDDFVRHMSSQIVIKSDNWLQRGELSDLSNRYHGLDD